MSLELKKRFVTSFFLFLFLACMFVDQIFLIISLCLIFITSFYEFSRLIKKIFGFKFNLKEGLFISFSFIINLVLVVNLLLKNLWGRARPNDIVELGGQDLFTPWYEFSKACETNCSFVSGDASVGFSTIMFFFITKNILYLWLALLFGFGLGVIRILEGGHYFSDVLLGGFLIFILCLGEFYLYKKKYLNNEY